MTRHVRLAAWIAILFLPILSARPEIALSQEIWPYSFRTAFKNADKDQKQIVDAVNIKRLKEKKKDNRVVSLSGVAPAEVGERAVLIFRHDAPRKIRSADVTITFRQRTGGAIRFLVSTDGVKYHLLDGFEARGRDKLRTEVYDITPLVLDKTTVWVRIEMVADTAPPEDCVQVNFYRLRADFEAWNWFENTRKFIWTDHPAVTIACVKKPPILDGKLTEKIWSESAVIGPFLLSPTKRATWPTEVRMCYDPENLYIAVRAHCNPKPSPAPQRNKPSELKFWRDRIVFAIDNDLDPWSYYKIEIDRAGRCVDEAYGFERDGEWRSDASVQIRSTQDEWVAEIALPFRAFDQTMPERGSYWGMAIGRYDSASREFSVWSPTFGGTFQPTRFGAIYFGGYEPMLARRVDLGALFIGRNQVNTTVINLDDRKHRLKLSACVERPGEAPILSAVVSRIPSKKSIDLNAAYDVEGEGIHNFQWLLQNDSTTGVIAQSPRIPFMILPLKKEIAACRKELDAIRPKVLDLADDVLTAEFQRLSDEIGRLDVVYPSDEDTWDKAYAELQAWKPQFEEFRKHLLVALARRKNAPQPGYLFSLEPALKKYARNEPLGHDPNHVLEIRAGRGEYEYGQLLIYPVERKLSRVRVSVGTLRRTDGNTLLPADVIQLYRAGYVECLVGGKTVELPDPLFPNDLFDVALKQNQSVWIRVHVPRGATPGVYRTTLTIDPGNAPKQEAELKVRVWDFELPRRPFLSACFTFPHLPRVLEIPAVRAASTQIAFLERVEQDFLAHRVSSIAPRSLGCVQVRQERNGKRDFAFDVLDETLGREFENGRASWCVGFCLGSAKGILPPLILRMNAPLRASPSFLRTTLRASPLSDVRNRKLFELTLQRYAEWLKAKGWLDRSWIFLWDQPRAEDYKVIRDAARLVRLVAPSLKILVTSPPCPPLESSVDIWCPRISMVTDRMLRIERSRNKDFWWYVDQQPLSPYPNFFIEQQPIDHRMLFWMIWRYQLDGFLYPASAVGDATEDRPLQPLIYTRGEQIIDSIRWECVRDGIEDYDYFALTKDLLTYYEREKEHPDPKLIADARRVLAIPKAIIARPTAYTHDPRKLSEYREVVAHVLERLTYELERIHENQK